MTNTYDDRQRLSDAPPHSSEQPLSKSFVAAGILLGLGLGGFFDGIVLHQILQWHHLLSNVRPMHTLEDVKVNTVADGLFHLLDYGLTIAGITVLWRTHQKAELPKSAQPFVGLILIGAGLFNLVEGFINHQILRIHHVRSGEHFMLWDIGFLASGALLITIGVVLTNRYQYRIHSTTHSHSTG